MAPGDELNPNLPFPQYYSDYTQQAPLDYVNGNVHANGSAFLSAPHAAYPYVTTSSNAGVQAGPLMDLNAQQQQLHQQPQPILHHPQYAVQPVQIQPQQHRFKGVSQQQSTFGLSQSTHAHQHRFHQNSPTESLSHSLEAYPPHLSNSPESGVSVRTNSPSATGSPQMNNCIAPGLQTAQGLGLVPAIVHQESYGSDQSQPYESMYDPVATSADKAGGFVGESGFFPSSRPSLSPVASLDDSDHSLDLPSFPCQYVDEACLEKLKSSSSVSDSYKAVQQSTSMIADEEIKSNSSNMEQVGSAILFNPCSSGENVKYEEATQSDIMSGHIAQGFFSQSNLMNQTDDPSFFSQQSAVFNMPTDFFASYPMDSGNLTGLSCLFSYSAFSLYNFFIVSSFYTSTAHYMKTVTQQS